LADLSHVDDERMSFVQNIIRRHIGIDLDNKEGGGSSEKTSRWKSERRPQKN
jgi:hypothetical protein